MIKWAFGIVITAVMILGVVAYLPFEEAEAKGNTIVITGTTGDDRIRVFDSSNRIDCVGCSGLTVTGPVTGPTMDFATEIWTITSGAGDGVNDKYKINGNGGSDGIIIFDGSSTDKDKYEIENAGFVRIFDGDGNDKYKIKDSSEGSVEYFDGPGKDKVKFDG